jgi:hypothetical protein
MAQQQKSGKPWSGRNTIPNIQQFVESFDKGKTERDSHIDRQHRSTRSDNDIVRPHKNEPPRTKGKTVTDPVTGNQVVIENIGKDFMKTVDDPMVWRISLKTVIQIDKNIVVCSQCQLG